jgi:hypothetical protein
VCFVVNRMKERVHEIDSGAYIIMSEVADIFSNKSHLIKWDIDIINVK